MAALCGLEYRRAAVGIRGVEVAPGTDEEFENLRVAALCGLIAGVLPSVFAASTLHLASMKFEKL